MPSAVRWGKLLQVPPAPAKHDAGRASPIAITVWPSPGPSSALAFRLCCFWLTSFLQIYFLPFAVPSLPTRYNPTTMSEAAAADADTTKVNLVSLSSTVSICFCGDFPVRGGRESRVRDLQSTGTESQSEAGGRPRRELWLSAGFAQPCSDRTGPGGAFILSKG